MQRKEGSVVQSWIAERLSFKQQAVVLSALRGCDGIAKEDTSKSLTRAFRGSILNPAEDYHPTKSFMGLDPDLATKVDQFVEHTDHYPVHWVFHFAHACEIVGYKHPNEEVADFWRDIYERIVWGFHLITEPEHQCDYRLRDNANDHH